MNFDEILYGATEGLVALGVVGLLLVASEIGFRCGGMTRHTVDDTAKSQLPVVQAALLGLIALLLGFTMSMAVSRFEKRQDLVVQEANAIGTAHLRARLIPGDGEAIAGLLRDYLDARLRFDDGDAVHQQAARVESEQLQERLWSRAGGIAQQDPRAITSGLLLQALNETFDLASARMAALANRVPVTVILLAATVGMIGMGAMSYGYGLGNHRHIFSVLSLALAIALVLMVIVDLDRPGRGFIRVSERSMLQLQTQLHAPVP